MGATLGASHNIKNKLLNNTNHFFNQFNSRHLHHFYLPNDMLISPAHFTFRIYSFKRKNSSSKVEDVSV